jgi:hypothetical protein
VRFRSVALLLGLVAATSTSSVAAQDLKPRAADVQDKSEDHSLVLEIGAAGDWSRDEGFHPGGAFAFEVTLIEHWLELEGGVAAIRGDASTETPVGVLFKKPWQFSPQFEFMIGAGPELVHATGPEHATFWGLSAVLDFMFWPRKNVGWYVEPGYEVTFHGGVARPGLAITGGLLIGR